MSLVSLLSSVGTMRIIAPIIILIPSAIGIIGFETFDIKYNAINGDQEPKISPALYENPAELFRICVGNLSEKYAGIGPDAVDTTNANKMTNSINPNVFAKITFAKGIETKIETDTKINIDFFRPIFCDNQPVKIIPIQDEAVA